MIFKNSFCTLTQELKSLPSGKFEDTVNKRNLKIALLSLLVVFCTSGDLTTKWLAKQQLEQGKVVSIIDHYVELRYTENRAIAFSMLQFVEPNLRKWIIYSLSLVAIAFLSFLIWKVRNDSVIWLVSLMLVFSGAIGNLSERLVRGYVIDFIRLHYYDKWEWPIFNTADIFITCGAILLGILMMKKAPENSPIGERNKAN